MKADHKGICAVPGSASTIVTHGGEVVSQLVHVAYPFTGRGLGRTSPITQGSCALVSRIFPWGVLLAAAVAGSVGTLAVRVVHDSFLFSLLFQ